MHRAVVVVGIVCGLAVTGCGGEEPAPSGPPDVYFDLGADTAAPHAFWSMPFPSDLRMTGDGHLDLDGFPESDAPLIADLLQVARDHVGAPMMPVVYVRF